MFRLAEVPADLFWVAIKQLLIELSYEKLFLKQPYACGLWKSMVV